MRRKLNTQANNEANIDYTEHVRTAWSYINKNAAKYADDDLKIIKNSIINTAKKYGVEIEVF